MAKVGLKDTLALLAKGYTKKDIEALALIDEENNNQDPEPAPVVPAPIITDSKPESEEKDPEPDYKSLYEDLLKKNQETENIVKKIQQNNVHKNSAPLSEEAKKKEAEALTNLVRSFM